MNTGIGTGTDMARLRREKKLTQAELAQRVGVVQRTIAAYESGERRPSVDVAKELGRELGMDWTEFYKDGPEDDE